MSGNANDLVVNQPAGPALSATSDAPKAMADDAGEKQVTLGEVLGKTVDTETPNAEAIAKKVAPKEPTVDEIIADPADIDPKKLKKSALQERFGELTTKQKEAIGRAEAAEGKLREIEAKEQQARDAEAARIAQAPKPKREEFADPDAYDEALITWSKTQGKREGMTEAQQAQQREANEKSQVAAHEAYTARVTEFAVDIPDFAEVAYKDTDQGGPPVTPIMAQAIMLDENGPAVAYHLGKHVAEAARIAALSPPQQVFEMGKLSAKVTKPAPQLSRAPAPISRIRSNGPANGPDRDAMAGDDYYNLRMAEIKAARAN